MSSAKIRAINRLICVGEAMRFALNSLAIVAGDWLLAHCEEGWMYRYGHRTRVSLSTKQPNRERETGRSDWQRWGTPLKSYARSGSKISGGRMVKSAGEATRRCLHQPALSVLGCDHEARVSQMRSTTWVTSVHLTETCDEDSPHLITHVATTPAPTADEKMVGPIHDDLKQVHLLPREHLLDSGYVTSQSARSQ